MSETRILFDSFAEDVAKLCAHISVRHDENGPYVFALGVQETHTLQLRKMGDRFVVQLWHGKTADVEQVIEEPAFDRPVDAFARARQWLQRDAVTPPP